MNWESAYAKRMGSVQPSPIMDLIRVMGKRQVINFASGLPDPAGFPLERLRAISAEVLADDWKGGLQYGEAEGYRPLREWVARDLTARGVATGPEQVLITNGSQQGIDLVARALLNPGDIVLVEQPSYLAALQVFDACEATVRALPMDDDGLDPAAAAAALRAPGIKLLYTMPSHQNPSGRTLAADRRPALLRAAASAGVPVLADEAYLHLRYDPGEPALLAAADPHAPVITVGTFSKTIAPGLRVAWTAGPRPVIDRLALLKQVTDLHTNSFAQRVVYRYVAAGEMTGQIQRLRQAYRAKRDAFLAALRRHVKDGATWTHPAGGMFLLLQLSEGKTAGGLLPAALDAGVAFVPGAAFFPGGGGEGTMRLNFVSPAIEQIDDGVARLAAAIGK